MVTMTTPPNPTPLPAPHLLSRSGVVSSHDGVARAEQLGGAVVRVPGQRRPAGAALAVQTHTGLTLVAITPNITTIENI